MKKTGKYVLMFLLVLVIVLGILAVTFWDVLSIYLFPKMVLTEAVSHTIVQLQQRFEGDPALLLLKYLDTEGKQTIQMDADVTDPLMGSVHYDMQIQVEPHRLFADGKARTGQRDLDLSVYMDADFMAVSSGNLVNGSYYGITYRTFMQDIRSIPLLSWMIGEPILRGWNDSVMDIQAKMEKGYQVPRIPDITEEEVRQLLLVLVAAPSDVQRTTIFLQQKPMECHRIAYSISGPEVLAFLKTYLNVGENAQTATVDAAFYLCENTLVLADITLMAGKTHHIQMELGKQCLVDPLTLIVSEEESDRNIQVRVRTEREAGKPLHESWEITGWKEKRILLSYDWDPNTQNMRATIDEGAALELHLSETEAGLRIETENLSELYRAVLGGEQNNLSRSAEGVLVITPGTGFQTPEYKNLDKWSMDDFWVLLEGIGGLLGITYH